MRPLTTKTSGSTETDINWSYHSVAGVDITENNLVFSPSQAAALPWDRMLLGFFTRLPSAALLSLVPVSDVQYLIALSS